MAENEIFIGRRQRSKQNGKVHILLNVFLVIHFRSVFPTPGFSSFWCCRWIFRFSPKSPGFLTLISRFLVFWGWEDCFYYSYRCLEAFHLHIFMIQMLCTVMQLFQGSYFSVHGATSRHFWHNSATANVDFQKSPSSDFIWRGTKDFSYLIGANFTDPKTGRCAWTNQNSSQGPLGIKLSLTCTKRTETWRAVWLISSW